MPTKIIILAGPGNGAFGKNKITEVEEAFKQLRTQTIRIGDGETALSISDIDSRLLTQITSSNDHIILFIMAHGIVVNGHHEIDLTGDKHSMKSKDLFQKIATTEKPIDIVSTACYGGAACMDAREYLPRGSTYISLCPPDETFFDKNLMNLVIIMRYWGITNPSLTAEQLLILYLTKGILTKTSPSIGRKDLIVSLLHDKLVAHLGKNFSDAEKTLIYNHLNPLVNRTEIDSIITKIESATNPLDILHQDFGLSLAVCHTASGDMMEHKLSFELSQPFPTRKALPFGIPVSIKPTVEPSQQTAKTQIGTSQVFPISGNTRVATPALDFLNSRVTPQSLNPFNSFKPKSSKVPTIQDKIKEKINALFQLECIFWDSSLGLSIEMPTGATPAQLHGCALLLENMDIDVTIKPEKTFAAELVIKNETVESLNEKLNKTLQNQTGVTSPRVGVVN